MALQNKRSGAHLLPSCNVGINLFVHKLLVRSSCGTNGFTARKPRRERGELKRFITAVFCTFVATMGRAECAKPPAAPAEYKQSQVVIIATVQSARPVPQTWDSLDGTDYLVHIDQKVKGKQSDEMTIFSEHSADGFSLEIGKQYLLFLNEKYQRWEVNSCGNSIALDQAAPVIKQLAHMMGND